MTSQVRRYTSTGPTAASINSQIGNGTASVSPAVPFRMFDVTLSDSAAAEDCDAFMAAGGWTFLEINPPAAGALGVVQTLATVLGADSSAINPSANWVTVLTRTFDSKGGTTARAEAALAIGSTGLGNAQARMRLDGVVFDPDYIEFPVLTRAPGTIIARWAVPVTAGYTTYTLTVQVQSPGALTTATARKGCSLAVTESDSTQV